MCVHMQIGLLKGTVSVISSDPGHARMATPDLHKLYKNVEDKVVSEMKERCLILKFFSIVS